ncbi:hypothetical protein [Acinetobacter sp. ANC 3813]|uniref:hypothetical protein n=1 Tax=Acinetobacter sp. ANC 3813 TaxID=1977873 RepID=UPI000A342159|nr:hypothetical protein [Acinetobacter sp. ANC 3813]OTG88894.1 hypothetical protein B9T34_14115 [Acinetobacter sp. ANC 3813]
MATDIDVQYFSHLNGLTLGNNWGDLIRLLDTCLVNGLALPSVTSASIDAQGDITLNLYASHNCQLFQIVELTGFNAVSLGSETRQVNGKYRIKGVPAANQLILKGIARTDTNPTAVNLISIGAAKLASLGYEIIFRDAADVKRVYRAKNPTSAHPFIRVDETISDGANSYTSTYAKSAMVGLIENMIHIDDYSDTSKLQLPLDTADFTKNWKITGTGTAVVKGWAKWYWATAADAAVTSMIESNAPSSANRTFTITGDADAFYLLNARTSVGYYKFIAGAGLINSALTSAHPAWFLMANLKSTAASSLQNIGVDAATSPLTNNAAGSKFLTTSAIAVSQVSNHVFANPIQPSFKSGAETMFGGGGIGALEIPIYDDSSLLRGVLPFIAYSGKSHGAIAATTPLISEHSMYVYDALTPSGNGAGGGIYFYLGEME